MTQPRRGVFVRQQAWLRASANPEGLTSFDVAKVDALAFEPLGRIRIRVLVGRGPFTYEPMPEFRFWFEHGELDYPVFQVPGIGPPNAGIKLTSRPSTISVDQDEVLCLIEASFVGLVDAGLQQNSAEASAAIHQLQNGVLTWLEQAIGLYALYQYPLIWEMLGIHPVSGFIDFSTNRYELATRYEADVFMPFRLNVAAKVVDNDLVDGCLKDIGNLSAHDLHLPLLLLQRSTWNRNIELRFLETFLILDHLVGLNAVKDEGAKNRQEMFDVIDQFVRAEYPQFSDRVASLKYLIVQAPLRERMSRYLAGLGVSIDEPVLGQLLRTRNKLAHGQRVTEVELRSAESQIREIARKALRAELANRGVTFGNP